MTTAVSAATAATPVSSGSTTKTALAEATASQDRFLKLLVAQLNNQDPMNPMDNAQMTSQMAQINTVTGIQQLNETMKSMGGQFASMQALQSTSLIGHDVLLEGNTLSVDAGKAKGAIELSSRADTVKVDILSPNGQLLDTLNLGAMGTGRHDFEWDASGYTGVGSPHYNVTATQGGKNVETTPFAKDTIASVGTSGSTLSVQLKGREAIAYEAIQVIY
ncbi:MAG: flagellar hook assembly protein FlgD [Burkholderiaceae bacterium]|nr:flagellar hook assembly protein FlgD [Burkholderiaceae bacterium]